VSDNGEDVRSLPLFERGRLAGQAAIEDVIELHGRHGVPIALLIDGKVVEISADEYRARRAKKKLAQETNGQRPAP
jgi:hypothetical protein